MFKWNQFVYTFSGQKNIQNIFDKYFHYQIEKQKNDFYRKIYTNYSSSDTSQLLSTNHSHKVTNQYRSYHHYHHSQFKLTKALIITKLSRYEFEQHRHPELSSKELEQVIRNRGTDYDAMIYYHNLHKDFEKKVANSFQDFDVEIKLVNRITLTKENIKWADLLVPIGGDGTFLLAAGRASPLLPYIDRTPIVGFNSDPIRSEGRLMLPKKYSSDPKNAVRKIFDGNFKWIQRARIRVTLLGENGNIPQSMDLHEHTFTPMEHIDLPPVPLSVFETKKFGAKMKRVLPYLALNEVFIGETVAARVSHLHLTIDDSEKITKTKSSGLCVSTGTGSTSWLTSINRLSLKNVKKLIDIIKSKGNTINHSDAQAICDEYNKQLIFPADDPRLCYSIREQICIGVWPNPKGFESRGFARNLLIKSRCVDASLVIDGSIAFPFNDGAKALLEVHPEDSLLTILIDD